MGASQRNQRKQCTDLKLLPVINNRSNLECRFKRKGHRTYLNCIQTHLNCNKASIVTDCNIKIHWEKKMSILHHFMRWLTFGLH